MTTKEEKIENYEQVFIKLKEMLGLSDEVVIRLNNKFFESVSLTLIQLSEAVKTVDYEAMETLAHSIKGSSGSLCYVLVSDISGKLEEHAQLKEEYPYQENLYELLEQFHREEECYTLWKEKRLTV